jgi:TPR repeat protein
MGSFLHEGFVFPKNDDKALEWLKKSAENGFSPAKSLMRIIEFENGSD